MAKSRSLDALLHFPVEFELANGAVLPTPALEAKCNGALEHATAMPVHFRCTAFAKPPTLLV